MGFYRALPKPTSTDPTELDRETYLADALRGLESEIAEMRAAGAYTALVVARKTALKLRDELDAVRMERVAREDSRDDETIIGDLLVLGPKYLNDPRVRAAAGIPPLLEVVALPGPQVERPAVAMVRARAYAMYEVMREHGCVSNPWYREKAGRTMIQASQDLTKWCKAQILRRTGPKHSARYLPGTRWDEWVVGVKGDDVSEG